MEKEEAKKKFLMKVGVISVMVLILVFWILNIKNVFQSNAALDNGESTAKWQAIKSDFNNTVDKMSQSLDKIQATDAKLKAASSSLINELIAETNKIASSSEATVTDLIATSSPTADSGASSSLKNTNCPAYINCMPTIGETKSCQVPVGCEGVTLIAY